MFCVYLLKYTLTEKLSFVLISESLYFLIETQASYAENNLLPLQKK